MKIFKIMAVLLSIAFTLSGCDFFRSIAGKPTSKELAQLKIDAANAEKQKQDSIARAAQIALNEQNAALKNSLDKKYYVVVGSFKVPKNADNFKERLDSKGYNTQIIQFKNGYKVLAAFGSDNYAEAYREMEKIMEFQFCPYDVWIYDISQQLHK